MINAPSVSTRTRMESFCVLCHVCIRSMPNALTPGFHRKRYDMFEMCAVTSPPKRLFAGLPLPLGLPYLPAQGGNIGAMSQYLSYSIYYFLCYASWCDRKSYGAAVLAQRTVILRQYTAPCLPQENWRYSIRTVLYIVRYSTTVQVPVLIQCL